MSTNIQVAFGVVAVILVFAPACLLVVASIKVLRNLGDFSAFLIAIGAVLLTIVSLDFLYSYAIALFFGPEKLAAYSLLAFYVFKGIEYFALSLIGVGRIRFARRAKISMAGAGLET